MMMKLFMLMVASLCFLAERTTGENAVMVMYNETLGNCTEFETNELKIAMFKSVRYYDGSQLNQTCSDFCTAAGLDDLHCTVVHPDCKGTLYSVADNGPCEKEIDAIEQALDLVGNAMESYCEDMVKHAQYACILEK